MSALDDIRKLAAEEREVALSATPGPLVAWRELGRGGRIVWTVCTTDEEGLAEREVALDLTEPDAEAFARSRAAVPALCDAVDSLLSVVDALPKCDGHDHTFRCLAPATKRSDERCSIYCDVHAPKPYEATGGQCVSWRDLPYASALRALLGGGAR